MADKPKPIVQNTLRVSNRAEWRSWLKQNHDKKAETRARRLKEAIQKLQDNEKPGMK